jgi:hypothetical protein
MGSVRAVAALVVDLSGLDSLPTDLNVETARDHRWKPPPWPGSPNAADVSAPTGRAYHNHLGSKKIHLKNVVVRRLVVNVGN